MTTPALTSVGVGVCERCGGTFVCDYPVQRLRKYCDSCQPLARKETKAKYQLTQEGKAALARARIKYRQTKKGKEALNEAMVTYRHTPEGRVKTNHNATNFNSTPKGKAHTARACARRRDLSTNPQSFAARVELLHIMQEPCTACEAPYMATHQVDHIVALCLSGTDDWENLQPLCIKCHRKKTVVDLCKFRGRITEHKEEEY